jgi:hypothetical protein
MQIRKTSQRSAKALQIFGVVPPGKRNGPGLGGKLRPSYREPVPAERLDADSLILYRQDVSRPGQPTRRSPALCPASAAWLLHLSSAQLERGLPPRAVPSERGRRSGKRAPSEGGLQSEGGIDECADQNGQG